MNRMMNRFRTAMIFTSMALGLVTHANAQQAPVQTTPQGLIAMAVSGVKVIDGLDASIKDPNKRSSLARVRDAMDNQLIDAFQNTRKFKIIARSDLDKVLKEQALADSGNVNPDDPKTAKAFKLAGAEFGLVITIDDFQDLLKSVEITGLRKNTRTIRLSASGKLWNTTTGVLLESMSFPIETTDTSMERTTVAAGADGMANDGMLNAIVRQMSGLMANRCVDVIRPPKVLAKTGTQVTINRGDGTGIAVGQIWNVFALGKAMVDPDTGEVLGAEELLAGTVRVVSVLPKFSTAEVVSDTGFGVGAVLRPAAPPPPPAGAPAANQ